MDFIKTIVNKSNEVIVPDFKGKIVGLYFSAHWCPPCRGFTPKLSEKYKELISQGKPIEIIFVSADNDEESAIEYFKSMSWDMMIQYDDQDTKDLLDQKYEIEGIPTLVLVNGDNGELITADGREALFEVDFDSLPNYAAEKAKLEAEKELKLNALRSKFELSKVFTDSSIIDKDDKTVPLSSFENKVIGFYFSGSWCGPCHRFTPLLAEKYNELIGKSKPFEIIFVSSDRDSNSCKEYYSHMPWKCLQFSERDSKFLLSELFEVEGIPTLVLVDTENGKIITTDGRSELFEKDFDELKTSSVFTFETN